MWAKMINYPRIECADSLLCYFLSFRRKCIHTKTLSQVKITHLEGKLYIDLAPYLSLGEPTINFINKRPFDDLGVDSVFDISPKPRSLLRASGATKLGKTWEKRTRALLNRKLSPGALSSVESVAKKHSCNGGLVRVLLWSLLSVAVRAVFFEP